MVRLTRKRSDSKRHKRSVPYRPDDLSDHAHRQLIGWIGLALPILLYVLAGIRLTDGLEQWRLLNSVSAYYYTFAVAAFVGILFALSLFLFAYQGYKNKYHWADRAAAVTGGVAAIGVAFFPTAAPPKVLALSWWTPTIGVLHYVSAIVLFAVFAVFALWLFRKTASNKKVTIGKRQRNRIYLICGLVIAGSIIWAFIAGRNDKAIFVPESAALIAFAVSWLVKGYAQRTIVNAARSVAPSVKAAFKRGSKRPGE
jgi:hypothetical protein